MTERRDDIKELRGMKRFVVSWDDVQWSSLAGGAYCRHISVVTGLDGSDALERFCRENPDAIVGNCELESDFIARGEPRLRADVADIKSIVYGLAHMQSKEVDSDRRDAVALVAVLYAAGLTLTTFILRMAGC